MTKKEVCNLYKTKNVELKYTKDDVVYDIMNAPCLMYEEYAEKVADVMEYFSGGYDTLEGLINVISDPVKLTHEVLDVWLAGYYIDIPKLWEDTHDRITDALGMDCFSYEYQVKSANNDSINLFTNVFLDSFLDAINTYRYDDDYGHKRKREFLTDKEFGAYIKQKEKAAKAAEKFNLEIIEHKKKIKAYVKELTEYSGDIDDDDMEKLHKILGNDYCE